MPGHYEGGLQFGTCRRKPSWMHPVTGTHQKGPAGKLGFSLLIYQPHIITALPDKSSSVLKKLSCITAGIAPGGKVCRGGGLSLVGSLEERQGEKLVSRLHLAEWKIRA